MLIWLDLNICVEFWLLFGCVNLLLVVIMLILSFLYIEILFSFWDDNNIKCLVFNCVFFVISILLVEILLVFKWIFLFDVGKDLMMILFFCCFVFFIIIIVLVLGGMGVFVIILKVWLGDNGVLVVMLVVIVFWIFSGDDVDRLVVFIVYLFMVELF